VPNSIARAALFKDTVLAAAGAPRVEVVATAKRDLRAGETLDDLGYFMTYGQCENVDVARRERLLPMGVASGCTLLRDRSRDDVLSYDDVRLPPGRLIDRLRAQQDELFFGSALAAPPTAPVGAVAGGGR
jgi:predicted homoserine dehydrogenase-like protein